MKPCMKLERKPTRGPPSRGCCPLTTQIFQHESGTPEPLCLVRSILPSVPQVMLKGELRRGHSVPWRRIGPACACEERGTRADVKALICGIRNAARQPHNQPG